MKDLKSQTLMIGAALASVVALAAWCAGLLPSLAPLRLELRFAFGASFMLAAALAAFGAKLFAVRQQQAQHFFELLLRSGPEQLARLASGNDPLPLSASSRWFTTAQYFAERFAQNCEKLQHAEQSRAALEVRLRRGSARQEQIEAIFASLAEPVIAVNGFDEVILVNAAAASLFEIDEKMAIGQKLGQFSNCGRLADLLTETRRRKAIVRRGEIEFIDDGGNSRWFTATCGSFVLGDADGAGKSVNSNTKAVPWLDFDSSSKPGAGKLANANGKAAGAFAVLRDSGELKSAQKRNAEFVSAVSHEMKSPLAGIKAYVELLADGDAEDQQTREEFLGVIDVQADRLQRLIDNLLNIARIEAGMMNVAKDHISLNELLTATLDIVRPTAAAKHVQLSAEFSPIYLSVLADRDLMMQVAINLLSNAIKYTPEGGRVVLRTRAADDEVQFEVDDSGVGLGEEDQSKVFERFYRVNKDRHMANGTGLGLPLAKHIVEDVHGGRLTLQSTLGKGSVFTVSMPTAAQLV